MAAIAAGVGANIGGQLLTRAIFGDDIKGKSATDRRIREQYQTMVKDLRAAGLNPALAYGAASPATSAGGGSPTGRPDFDLAGGAAKGAEAASKWATTNATNAQEAKTRTEDELLKLQIPLAAAEALVAEQALDAARGATGVIERLKKGELPFKIPTGAREQTPRGPGGSLGNREHDRLKELKNRKKRPKRINYDRRHNPEPKSQLID